MSKELQYHVRKSWDDVASQVGIDYNFLINAQKACDKLEGYFVFDSNGIQVYPEQLNIGDEILLIDGATYISGTKVNPKFIGEKLIIQQILNDNCIIGYSAKEDTIGTVHKNFIIPYTEAALVAIDPYYISVNVKETNLRARPDLNSSIIGTANKYAFYKIVNESEGWGKLASQAGWINLADVQIIAHE